MKFLASWGLLPILAPVIIAASCSSQGGPYGGPVESVPEPVSSKYNWLQFGGSSLHLNNNTLETTITPQNVNQLTKLFQVDLPETIEGAPSYLTDVTTSSGVHDVAFVTTRSGYIVAMDAYSGQTLWSAQPASSNITMSSPAIDPSGAYVYSAGLDGYIHKYAVGTGIGGDRRRLARALDLEDQRREGRHGDHDRYGGERHQLPVHGRRCLRRRPAATTRGTSRRSTCRRARRTSSMRCAATRTCIFVVQPDCAAAQAGIWAKAGLAFDPVTNRLYAATGNGTFRRRRITGATHPRAQSGRHRQRRPELNRSTAIRRPTTRHCKTVTSTSAAPTCSSCRNGTSKYPHLALPQRQGRNAAPRQPRQHERAGGAGQRRRRDHVGPASDRRGGPEPDLGLGESSRQHDVGVHRQSPAESTACTSSWTRSGNPPASCPCGSRAAAGAGPPWRTTSFTGPRTTISTRSPRRRATSSGTARSSSRSTGRRRRSQTAWCTSATTAGAHGVRHSGHRRRTGSG